MMFCSKCGAELNAIGNFCEKCGSQIKTQALNPTISSTTSAISIQTPPPQLNMDPTEKPHSKLFVPGVVMMPMGIIMAIQGILPMRLGSAYFVLGLGILIMGVIILAIGVPLFIVGALRNKELREIHRIPQRKFAAHKKYLVAGIITTFLGLYPLQIF